MITRNLEFFINKYAKEYSVISIVGPRQSGKTTLAQKLFESHQYISLENLDHRQMAQDDPRGFLEDNPPPVIIDEVQRVPHLFSYLQERVDSDRSPAQYILTGSQQFLLMDHISQSLAGRVITFKLFPFTYNELYSQHEDKNLDDIFHIKKEEEIKKPVVSIEEMVFTGMFPRIHDQHLSPRKWIENYVMTYIERDIRQLVNVHNLRMFENFLKILASHSAQLMNYAAISNALGVSIPTIKNWISLLETSGIVFILPPHFKNFSKRVVKTPKLFFTDTGLLCFLLSIRNPTELKHHPLWGHIFETFIISEFYKRICHCAEIPPLFFWRDKTGNEIDLLVDFGSQLLPVEIKSSRTFSPNFKDGLLKWLNLKDNPQSQGLILYNGDSIFGSQSEIPCTPWWLV